MDRTVERTENAPQGRLKRALTTPMVVLYGLGVTVGAGIYVLVGQTAAQAGPYAPASFLFAAIVVAFTAFSYASQATQSTYEQVIVQEANAYGVDVHVELSE